MLKAIKKFFADFLRAIEKSRMAEVERYLSKSQNLVDLENRIREVNKGRYV